jgi:hypothetical protein
VKQAGPSGWRTAAEKEKREQQRTLKVLGSNKNWPKLGRRREKKRKGFYLFEITSNN